MTSKTNTPTTSQIHWITIQKFSHLHEAQLVESFLNSKDIQTQILDGQTISINWFWSNALQGVKLQVNDSDVQNALRYLNEADESDALSKGDLMGLTCPQCQSIDTRLLKHKQKKGIALVIAYLISIPLFFLLKEHWHCNHCHHQWTYRSPVTIWRYLIPIIVIIGLYGAIMFFIRATIGES